VAVTPEGGTMAAGRQGAGDVPRDPGNWERFRVELVDQSAAMSAQMEQIAIALDIGGTNIKACFRIRRSEDITWLEKIPSNAAFTDTTTNAEAAATVCAQLQCQLQAKGRSLLHASKLAISFADPIDLKTGHVLKAYNLGGDRHQGDLAAEFRRHLVSTYTPLSSTPPYSEPNVHIMNDALAPALAIVRALLYPHVSPAWAKLRTILPEHAQLPALCLSLGTSVGVSVIQQAPDGEIQIILPETWVSSKIPTRSGDMCVWDALGAGAETLSADDLKRRLLRDDGALACLLRLYQQEPALGPSPRSVVFIGGRALSLRGIGMDGTTWQNAQGAEPIVLAVPADVNELAMVGALSYGVSPMKVRVRRVAVIAGLEASGTEIFLGSEDISENQEERERELEEREQRARAEGAREERERQQREQEERERRDRILEQQPSRK